MRSRAFLARCVAFFLLAPGRCSTELAKYQYIIRQSTPHPEVLSPRLHSSILPTLTLSSLSLSPSRHFAKLYTTASCFFFISLSCSHLLASQLWLTSLLASIYRVVGRLSRNKGLCHFRVYTFHEVRTFPVCFSTIAAHHPYLTYYHHYRLADDGPRQSLNLSLR